MKTSQIQRAFSTIERDHQMVLAKVQALKETVSVLLDPSSSNLNDVLKRLRDYLDYFANSFAGHMLEEEATLFPLLEEINHEGIDLVGRLRVEHSQIRHMILQMRGTLDLAFELEDNLPRAVLRDLIGYGWELWEKLDNHADAETKGIHQCLVQSVLGQEPDSPIRALKPKA